MQSKHLYEKWHVVASRQPDELALTHVKEDKKWSFRCLDLLAKETILPHGNIVVSHADQPSFFPTILAAWQLNKPVLIKESHKDATLKIQGPIPEGTALIKQMCGASGKERSLFLSAEQLLTEAHNNVETLGLTPDRTGIAAISLAHSYGLGCLTLPLLLHGIPVTCVESALPVFVDQALKPEKKVFLPSVPALWKTWFASNILSLDSIDLAISAGSPLSLSLENEIWEKTGIKIHNFYGTSETGAISYDSSLTPRSDESYLGELVAGVSAKTENEIIHIQSKARVIGSDILLTPDEFSDDYYATQDIGEIKGKSVYLRESVGKAINVAGRKVSPEKIHRFLLKDKSVLSAIVEKKRSRDIERFEEITVEVKTTNTTDLKKIKSQLHAHLHNWEMPRHWIHHRE